VKWRIRRARHAGHSRDREGRRGAPVARWQLHRVLHVRAGKGHLEDQHAGRAGRRPLDGAPRVVGTPHYRRDQVAFLKDGYAHLFVVSTDGGAARQITTAKWSAGAGELRGALGLAEPTSPNNWRVRQDSENILRAMQHVR
jgi:hypothetical protein